jgi:hypothetical protein
MKQYFIIAFWVAIILVCIANWATWSAFVCGIIATIMIDDVKELFNES